MAAEADVDPGVAPNASDPSPADAFDNSLDGEHTDGAVIDSQGAAPDLRDVHDETSSPTQNGPATLHAAEMLAMAREFVRIFREQHPDRRPPNFFVRTTAGQQMLCTQLLRPTQVRYQRLATSTPATHFWAAN